MLTLREKPTFLNLKLMLLVNVSANWENMMNNMNIGGTELGSEDEVADSDDDGKK